MEASTNAWKMEVLREFRGTFLAGIKDGTSG
jgi:hypothetical protein